uniref:Uncharacterized protein n=1 Tax=Ditylenchus dipsaci TaxID=166011 RepID=A0A915DJY7_9BILA
MSLKVVSKKLPLKSSSITIPKHRESSGTRQPDVIVIIARDIPPLYVFIIDVYEFSCLYSVMVLLLIKLVIY